MKYCPRCGNLIEGTLNCIECGYKINEKKLKENNENIKIITNKNKYPSMMSVDNETYKQIVKNCTLKMPSNCKE